MIKRALPIVALSVSGLVGCATIADQNPCGIAGDYMAAETRQPLVTPEGLRAPDRSLQVEIPTGADVVHPELRGNMVEGDDGQMYCIDRPPPRRGLSPVR